MAGSDRTLAVLKYAALTLGAIMMVAPFLDMFLGALRTPQERLALPMVYWPHDPQWHNFVRVFTELPMLRWLWNSIVVTCAITAIQMATSTMAGYALAKYKFRGSAMILKGVLGAQMFPFFLLIIPIFFLLRYVPLAGERLDGARRVGAFEQLRRADPALLDHLVRHLPDAAEFHGCADRIIDAARIDSAGRFRIFAQIVLPLIKPGLATLGIFIFIYQWNEVIWTMTVTRSAPELQTMPVGIYLLRGAFIDQSTLSLQQAAVCVSIVPIMVVFLCLQRYYVRGLTAGV